MVDGGYIEGGVYHYYMTDHFGNNRVVVNASGTVIQRNHYYPFGTAFTENTVDEQKKQPYKYNGKELDQMHGLNLYDYSARYYESAVGRFTSVEPMAEKYYSISPYAYVANNPLKYIDPTGMWIYIYYGGTSYKYDDGKLYERGDDGKYTNEHTAEEGSFLTGVVSGIKDLSSKSPTGNWISNYFSNDEKNISIMSLSKDGANARGMAYGNAYD